MNLLGTFKATRSTEFNERIVAGVIAVCEEALADPDVKATIPYMYNCALEIMRNPESHPWMTQFLWRTAAHTDVQPYVQSDGSVTITDTNLVKAIKSVAYLMFRDEVTA